MPKLVIIGAGSGFGGRLSVDTLSRIPLQDTTIGLCDLHGRALVQLACPPRRAPGESRKVHVDRALEHSRRVHPEAAGGSGSSESRRGRRRADAGSPTGPAGVFSF